ncbi:L,D-transpeptidase [Ramlibacter sp. PS3R-8]|uniref:L,D-transpeptidase n=1 Tax=Ramlibacter sp. PS3R-8 TaxID=3133437 RepID=UPI00309C9733
MLDFRRWLRSAAVCTAWMAATPLALAAPDTWKMAVSRDAGSVLEWVRGSRDAGGSPFAVVDKRAARIYVFDAAGRLAGQSAVLLGSAPGDHTVPGVGLRAQTGHVPPQERTTPAGRFEASPGVNTSGEHVVWVDYESAFAIHRLRPGFSFKARADRLGNDVVQDRRVSWGCVVVPEAFYLKVVEPVLGRSRSIVYVLPESRPLRAVFNDLESN